jgi:hypothetical protein
MKGEAHRGKDETDAHKLLVEFYWLLHKIPEYIIRTNSEGCAESVNFTEPQLAGLRELWDLYGDSNLQVRRPLCAAWPSSWGS